MVQRNEILVVVIIFLIAPLLNAIVCAETQMPAQIENALHMRIPDPDNFAFASRNITDIPVGDSVIEFRASVKILRYQTTPAGIPLQIDLRGYSGSRKAQELRYSFRFSNDGGIIFFYPFMNSSAAVTIQKAWTQGKWYHLLTVVSDTSAKFYINETVVGENTMEHPARSSGFVLSRIDFGKTERQKIGIEAFVANILVIQNGTIRISENFKGDLKAYEIKSSGSALLKTIDPSKYASLDAYVRPATASAGDTVLLSANLLDGSLKGLSGRTIDFEYQSGDEWLKIASATTLGNGTARTSWRIPPGQSRILIHANFAGDQQFYETPSAPINLAVIGNATFRFEISSLVLPLYGLALLFMPLLAFRFGRIRVLRGLVPVLCSIVFLFSLSPLTDSIEIKSFIGYTPRTVRIQFLGSEIDRTLWILSTVTLIAAWMVHKNRSMLRYRETLIPVFSAAASLGLRLSGMELTGSLLGMVSALVIAFFPILFKDEHERSPWETAIGFTAVLLAIIFVVEAGSAAGWLYNVIDPHVPFDGESRWIVASLEMNLFGLLYPITLVALIVMIFSWIWIPLFESSAKKPLVAKLSGRSTSINTREHFTPASNPSQKEKRRPMEWKSWQNLPLSRSRFAWPLTMIMLSACSVFLVYYPYLYATRLIGVDTPWYHQNLLAMSTSDGLSHLISSYGAASRIPYLLILYILMSVTSFPPDLVVKIGPAVPAAFLGATTLFLTRKITDSNVLAVLSSFLGLFSIATTVGIYAGIFANWLALGWAALFLGLLSQMWKHPSPRKTVVTTLVSFIILVTHAWTWAVTMASLGTFVVLSLLYRLASRRGNSWDSALRSSAIIVGANAALLLLIVSRFYAGEFMHLSREGIASISFDNLATFPYSFAFTVQFYVGGFIANPALIVLATVGVAVAKMFDEKLRLFLLSMLIVTSIPLVLVGSWWQWRLLYMIPYQVLAVLGITGVSQKIIESDGNMTTLCQSLLMATILLASFNYALRSLNFIPS